MQFNQYTFKKAIPVWECGTQKTMNRSIAFVSKIDKCDKGCKLSLAGSSAFIILVNGETIAHGPARAGHGYYRVDEYVLDKYLTQEHNSLEIRIAGYNINSFEYLNVPSFLCAEVICGDDVLACTSAPCHNFDVFGIDERIMKVQRFSYQRVFTENYILDNNFFDYSNRTALCVEPTEEKQFICRDIPYGEYDRIYPISLIGRGSVSYSDKEKYYDDRAVVGISNTYLGYKESELEYASHVEIGKMDFGAKTEKIESAHEFSVDANTYVDMDMGVNHCGLFEFELEVEEDGEFFITFDEILCDGHIDCFRGTCSDILAFVAKAGSYKFVSAEPYVMRYIRLIAKNTAVKVKDFKLIEVAFPKNEIKVKFVSDDPVMKKIYNAAVQSFRENTVDIYMDCPSRERAGWLCDSFFTSRVERVLTGKSQVEKQFLSNFLMPGELEYIPHGMLSMCYPSDQSHAMFIPNWAMWYLLELDEYRIRTGDIEFIEATKDRMYALYNYFKSFENEYGLLEKLESWVFVEWSMANNLVQDVSFASNMLYSMFLRSMYNLYGDEELLEKSEKLKETINRMAMTESGFFCDNAIRQDGKLVLTGERTEVCQYYAFFCGIATPESHTKLWDTLVNDFGYNRANTGAFPEIYPANAFIGNYLRLELLNRYGYMEELYDNIRGYFEYMADTTGTLWEHKDTSASCNHGFASHVIYWMKALGIVE